MALLRYFKKIDTDKLPDPNGSLSTEIPPKEIASANKLVKETEATRREPYNKFSPETRAAIGEYASHHGPTKTARRFTKLLKTSVNESTVRSIHKAYVLEVSRKRKFEDCPTISVLPTKKRVDRYCSERR